MTTILSSIVNIIGGGGDLYNLFNEHKNPQFDDESDIHIELQKLWRQYLRPLFEFATHLKVITCFIS